MQPNNQPPEFVHMIDRIQLPNSTPEERMERLRIEIRNQIKYLRRHVKTLKRACQGTNMAKISDAAYNYNGTIYKLKKYLNQIKEFENPTLAVVNIINIAEETIDKAWYELNN